MDLQIIYSDTETLHDKRASLFNLLKKANKNGLKAAIYEALLINGYEQSIYDLHIFEEYLERPIFNFGAFSDKVQKAQAGKTDYLFRELVKYKPNIQKRPSDETIIEDHVLHFLKDQAAFKSLSKFFKKDWITGVFIKNKVMNGGDMNEFIEHFGQYQANLFADSQILDFDASTKRVFRRNEEVFVHLKVKNIQRLTCKVFAVNTAQYYATHQKEIDDMIDLDGLLPQYCYDYSFSQPKQQQHVVRINFEHIRAKQQGVFIAEFTGGTQSCRFVIKKGTLELLPFDHFLGVGYFIIDEDKNVCVGEGTGVLVDGRFHACDAEGKLLFPFNRELVSNKQVVAVHRGFASLTQLTIPREDYSLKTAMIVNEEGLVTPGMTRAILRHQLFLNNTVLSLKKAVSCDVLVEMRNFEELTNCKEFKAMPLLDDEDLVVEFAVPKLLSHLTVTTTLRFKNSRGEEVLLTGQHAAEVNRNKDEDKFSTIHLITVNNTSEFALRLLGKNGEPIPDHLVQVQFLKSFGPYDHQHYLYTDAKGTIKLGKLEHTRFIQAECLQDSFSKRLFVLPNDYEKVDIPKVIEMCTTERLALPLQSLPLTRENFEFVRVSEHPHIPGKEIVISDCFDLLKAEDGTIAVSALLKGEYLFRFNLFPLRQVRVVVHEGSRWQNNPYVLQKARSLTRLTPESRYLAVKELVRTPDNKIKIAVSSNAPATLRCHVNGYVYHSEAQDFLQISLKKTCPVFESKTTHLKHYQNVLLSNRVLSDEHSYILNRKTHPPLDGNTLDKPSLLLHRFKIRETKDDEEQLRAGDAFKPDLRQQKLAQDLDFCRQVLEDAEEDGIERCVKAMPTMDRMEENSRSATSAFFEAGKKKSSGVGGTLLKTLMGNFSSANKFDGVDWSTRPRYDIRFAENHRQMLVQNNMDFSKNNGRSEVNIKPNKEGDIYIDLNKFKGCGVLQVCICDKHSCVMMTCPVSDPTLIKKDIRVKNVMKPGSIWKLDFKMVGSRRELDGCHYVREEGLSNLETRAIEDIGALAETLLNIASPTVDKLAAAKWQFLSRWQTFSEDQKAHLLEEFGGHELYLFLFVRDRPFFDSRVRDLIRFKAKKQLLDELLLGDASSVKDPTNLNPLELFFYILLTNQYSMIDSIAQKCIAPVPTKFFESVMNMNSQADVHPADKLPPQAPPSIQTARPQADPLAHAMGDFKAISGNQLPSPPHDQMLATAEADGATTPRNCKPQDLEGFLEVPAEDELPQLVIDEFKQPTQAFEFKERQDYFEGQLQALQANRFWLRLFQNLRERGVKKGDTVEYEFLVASEDLLCMNGSNAEVLCALAFARLPLLRGRVFSQEQTGEMFHQKASEPFMVLIKSTKVDPTSLPLDLEMVVNQKFFDPADRHVYDAADPSIFSIKEVREFLTAKVYECRISITNLGETSNEVTVISQVPEGSLPVSTLEDFKLNAKRVDPMATEFISFKFYFPEVGNYNYYPATVMKNNRFVACAKTKEDPLRVVEVYSPGTNRLETLQEVVVQGSIEEVFRFIQEKNIFNERLFDISKIRWVCKHSKDAFMRLISILRKNFAFDEQIWAYSIYHGCYPEFRELLAVIAERFVQKYQYVDLGKGLKLCNFEPLEYDPLVNPRAHELTDKKINIRNKEFRETYSRFLLYCCEKVKLELKDWIVMLGYWILQDRVKDAINLYRRIDKGQVEKIGQMLVQFEYIEAYLSVYQESPEYQTARRLSKKYERFPDLSWRERFQKIGKQIEEYDRGRVVKSATDLKLAVQTRSNKELAERVEFLKADRSGREKIRVTHRNIDRLKIQFFKLDLEILFSKDPFFAEGSKHICTTTPNHELKFRVAKSEDFRTSSVDIPQTLLKECMMVQVSSKDRFEVIEMFNSELAVFALSDYGLVKIQTLSGEPLHSAYVKCYAKYKDEREVFYKDGYSDFRGSFDYASLNSNGVQTVAQFAIFVSHPQFGSTVVRASPPSAVSRAEFVPDASSNAEQSEVNYQDIFLEHFTNVHDGGMLE